MCRLATSIDQNVRAFTFTLIEIKFVQVVRRLTIQRKCTKVNAGQTKSPVSLRLLATPFGHMVHESTN